MGREHEIDVDLFSPFHDGLEGLGNAGQSVVVVNGLDLEGGGAAAQDVGGIDDVGHALSRGEYELFIL